MSLRLKRLTAEHDRLQAAFAAHPQIRIRPDQMLPPERYEVDYLIKGLELLPSGEIVARNEHTIEIVLPAEYPRQPPMCRMKTPVFHPNIDTWSICTSDHWSAQEFLVDLIPRIGQMICYQSYNTKSPLNAEAALWCDKNASRLPVDVVDLLPIETRTDTDRMEDAISECEDILARIEVASETNEAHVLLLRATAVLDDATDIAKAACVNPSLVDRHHELQAQVGVIQAHLERLEAWSAAVEAVHKRSAISVQLQADLQDMEALTRDIERMPPPAWLSGGTLTASHLSDVASAIQQLVEKCSERVATLREQSANPADVSCTAGDCDSCPELSALARTIRERPLPCVPDSRAVALKAEEKCRVLQHAHALLRAVKPAVLAYETALTLQHEASVLEARLTSSCDCIEIETPFRRFRVEVGNHVEIQDGVQLTCRLRRSNGRIALVDEQRQVLIELSSSEPGKTFVHNGVSLTARPIGLTSREAHIELQSLFKRASALAALECPTELPSCQCAPPWVVSWIVPDNRKLLDGVKRRCVALGDAARRSFITGTLKTMAADLGAASRRVVQLRERWQAWRTELRSVEGEISEIVSKGRKLRDGRLQLSINRLAEYEAKNQRVAQLNQALATLKPQLEHASQERERLWSDLGTKIQKARKYIDPSILASLQAVVSSQLPAAVEEESAVTIDVDESLA